jgi:hypothetical protein
MTEMLAVKRFEDFADAVAHVNNYFDPESRAREMRNPGLLKGDAGNRIFSCHRAGYAALVDRIQKHCAAHPEEKLETLFGCFGITMRVQQEKALDFMSRCANSTLTLQTSLRWFLE